MVKFLALLLTIQMSASAKPQRSVPPSQTTIDNYNFLRGLYKNQRLKTYVVVGFESIGAGIIIAYGYKRFSTVRSLVWRTLPTAGGLLGLVMLTDGVFRIYYGKGIEEWLIPTAQTPTLADYFKTPDGLRMFLTIQDEGDQVTVREYLKDPELADFIDNLSETLQRDPKQKTIF